MPQKGSKKSLAHRGNVAQRTHGFRAQACIDGRTFYGPTRGTEAEANYDLRQAQNASSVTEYCSVLQRLVEDNQSNNFATSNRGDELVAHSSNSGDAQAAVPAGVRAEHGAAGDSGEQPVAGERAVAQSAKASAGRRNSSGLKRPAARSKNEEGAQPRKRLCLGAPAPNSPATAKSNGDAPAESDSPTSFTTTESDTWHEFWDSSDSD